MKKANKGEWSEAYTLFRLLGEGKLYAADDELNKIEDIYFPIIKILNFNNVESVEYHVDTSIKVILPESGEVISEIKAKRFVDSSKELLEKIKASNQTTFSIPEVEGLLERLKATEFKSGSRDKADIVMVLHDINTGINTRSAFSIKSQLGSPSTLVNAGKTTNFVFEVRGVEDNKSFRSSINNIDGRYKIKKRLQEIVQNGCDIDFKGVAHKVFERNLLLIDSKLPDIISWALRYHFGEIGLHRVSDIVERLEEDNPLGLKDNLKKTFYSYKTKKFLLSCALGMVPATAWDGIFEANSGYIIVKEDGEVLCYHIYNINDFETYLLNNTKLETASSSRHNYGEIYIKEGSCFINLNLQVRFVK